MYSTTRKKAKVPLLYEEEALDQNQANTPLLLYPQKKA